MKLKEAREAKKMSQTELALKVGVKSNTISMYEAGKREPKIELLKKIARELDISVDKLIEN